jgi:hypothetical protein
VPSVVPGLWRGAVSGTLGGGVRIVHDVAALIKNAFANVYRPRQNRFCHCAQCEIWLERFLNSPEVFWQDLKAEDIAYECSALNAVWPEGWRFLLPAYMTWHLANSKSDSSTGDHIIWNLTLTEIEEALQRQRFESLSKSQALAVLAFLQHVAGTAEEESQRRDAEKAIESHWRRAAA